MITKDFELQESLKIQNYKIVVWQGLADEDTDVDAINRLISDELCAFSKRSPVVLGEGTISTFNTQNTIIARELLLIRLLWAVTGIITLLDLH